MQVTPNFGWTAEAIVDLTRMWADGMSGGQIAKELGTGRSSVMGKIHRLKLGAPPTKAPKPKPERKTRYYAPPTQPDTTPEPVDPPIPFDGKGVTFIELTDATCRFPMGDPQDAAFRFCGRPPRSGSPYCRECHGLAYQPWRRA